MKHLDIKRFSHVLLKLLAIISVSEVVWATGVCYPATRVLFHPESAYASTRHDKKALPTFTPNLNILKVAHRGVKELAPENTLPAIIKAITLGYDYVELDVCYTRDGVPVLLHDIVLHRTTNGFGPLPLFKLEAIKKLDAGSWFGAEFEGTRIPTLEECLELMQGRIKLYLDQKQLPTPKLVRILKKYGFYPDNIVVVGRGFIQRRFSKYEPDAPFMPRLRNEKEVDRVLKRYPTAKAFNTSCKSLTHEMVLRAHRRGVLIFTNVLGLDDPARERTYMRRTIELGADAIQFDHHDVLFPLLEEMRREAESAAQALAATP